jgi:hypothetical protein
LVRCEVEMAMVSPGFFTTAARTPYADAVPDEVVRQFQQRYASCAGLDLPTLTKVFGWYPTRHFNDMVRMIAGRAMVHRGIASVDWNNPTTKTLHTEYAASYRIAGYMVSQLFAKFGYGRASVQKKIHIHPIIGVHGRLHASTPMMSSMTHMKKKLGWASN